MSQNAKKHFVTPRKPLYTLSTCIVYTLLLFYCLSQNVIFVTFFDFVTFFVTPLGS